jgi:hypothetical protein
MLDCAPHYQTLVTNGIAADGPADYTVFKARCSIGVNIFSSRALAEQGGGTRMDSLPSVSPRSLTEANAADTAWPWRDDQNLAVRREFLLSAGRAFVG